MDPVLRDQLVTILSQVKERPQYYWTAAVFGTRTLPDDSLPGTRKLSSEHLTLLRILYDQANDAQRTEIVEGLQAWGYSDESGSVIAHFLVHLKRYDVLAKIGSAKKNAIDTICRVLNGRLESEPHLFGESDFTAILGLLNGLPKATAVGVQYRRVGPAFETIRRIRYLRLRQQLLEGRSPEIDADQAMVIDRVARLGFSKPVADALRKINQQLAVASSGFDFKACVELVRTVLEEVVEEACHRIEPKTGLLRPSGPRVNHYQPYLQYLTNARLILKDESESLQKHYNLLSNEGSHSLEAAKEQAHVYRAMTIEWLLLITGRVETFLKQ